MSHAQPDNTGEAVQPQEWTQAFAAKSDDAFGDAFADNIVLEATALRRPLSGRAAVQTTMGTASRIYESLVFTHKTEDGPRTYIEWKATAFGGTALSGITILRKNDSGEIEHVAIHHRPLDGLLAFSAEMGRQTEGLIEPGHFYTENDTNGQATRQ
ncbi:nuclear transport factor 2 family protein [Rhodococcus sp. WS4]|nr:nuclear transport factor 2 family protein [Rhodococcus sp. WS4]